jgi:hypothetical protein
VRIEEFTKRDYIAFHARVHRTLPTFVWETYDARAIELYKHTPPEPRLLFLSENRDAAGIVHLDPGESKPDPKDFAEDFRFQDIVLLSESFTWAVRTGHEDWDHFVFGTPPHSDP